jgi:hypothetical protein
MLPERGAHPSGQMRRSAEPPANLRAGALAPRVVGLLHRLGHQRCLRVSLAHVCFDTLHCCA